MTGENLQRNLRLKDECNVSFLNSVLQKGCEIKLRAPSYQSIVDTSLND